MAGQPGGGIGFWLRPDDIEPDGDPVWSLASAADRSAFWRRAMDIAAREWDQSRAAGLDRSGVPLAALSPRTIKHRHSAMGRAIATAPPLTPANGLSRTRSYLRYRYEPGRGGFFYWKYDPRVGVSWGQILRYHADGLVHRAPARDVIGFSQAEIATVRGEMADWWWSRRDAARERAARDMVRLPERPAPVPRPITPPPALAIQIPAGIKPVPIGRRKALPWARPARMERVRPRAATVRHGGRPTTGEFIQFR